MFFTIVYKYTYMFRVFRHFTCGIFSQKGRLTTNYWWNPWNDACDADASSQVRTVPGTFGGQRSCTGGAPRRWCRWESSGRTRKRRVPGWKTQHLLELHKSCHYTVTPPWNSGFHRFHKVTSAGKYPGLIPHRREFGRQHQWTILTYYINIIYDCLIR